MILSSLLLFAVVATGTPCSAPTPQSHSGNYITLGALADVPYANGLTLDAYAPPGNPRPAAFIIHGSRGNKRTHVTQLFDVLERAGYAWFSVEYKSPADVLRAFEYVRCPGRFNITNEIFLIGADTGGQIALEIAGRRDGRSNTAMGPRSNNRLSHPVLGVAAFGFRPRRSGPTDATSHPASENSLPQCPVLMFHGTADDKSPLAHARALCARMPRCTFYAVEGAIHDFENWRPDQWEWKEDLSAWLRQDRRGLWKDITYARPDGRELLMDGWIPEGHGPFPAVIVMHGGGWEAADKVTYVSPVFEPLARADFAWFSIDYRLAPYVRVPDQLDDLRTAIRYVKQHHKRFHVDPNRIALLGESASGHLVSQLASEPCPGCEPKAVVSFYGVYDFSDWPEHPGDRHDTAQRIFRDISQDTLRRYSPIFHAGPQLPPMLLIQGSADELARGTLAYANRLKQVGARYQLVMLPGAPHGMENWEGHPEWAFYKQKMVDWLRGALNR